MKSKLLSLSAGVLALGGLLHINLVAADFSATSNMTEQKNNIYVQDAEGNKVQVKPDGTKVIEKADGTLIQVNSDGSKLIKRPDGTSIEVKADGTKIIKKADGTQFEVKPGN